MRGAKTLSQLLCQQFLGQTQFHASNLQGTSSFKLSIPDPPWIGTLVKMVRSYRLYGWSAVPKKLLFVELMRK